MKRTESDRSLYAHWLATAGKDDQVMVVNVDNRALLQVILQDPTSLVAIITTDGRRLYVPAKELAA